MYKLEIFVLLLAKIVCRFAVLTDSLIDRPMNNLFVLLFQDVTNANRHAIGGNKNRMNGAVDKKASAFNGISVKQEPAIEAIVLPRQNNNTYHEELEDRNPQPMGTYSSDVVPDLQRSDNMYDTTTTTTANPSSSYQYSGQVDNIDERDNGDPLCATEYVQDMYTLFREREYDTSVRPIYMEGQPHINERMRSILVDWLVEVHLKFKLVPETLYLTINLIDRYLERMEVSRPKLQLVGVTSLLIASKYEEIYPPELRDLVYICDRAYTRVDVSKTDRSVSHFYIRLNITHMLYCPT